MAARPSYPLKYNPATGQMEYLTVQGRQLIRNTVSVQPAATTSTDTVKSIPPAGYKKITNIYVDADGELVMEYTP